MSKQPMSRKSGAAQTSSSPGKKFEKEQAEAAAAGSKLVAALEAEKKVRSDLEETVAQDTQIIAAMDKELEETKKAKGGLEVALAEREEKSKANLAKVHGEWEGIYKRQEAELTEAKKRAHDVGRLSEDQGNKIIALRKQVERLEAVPIVDDSELQKVISEQAELIERLRAEAKESRKAAEGNMAAFRKLGGEYDALEAKKAVDGADPSVLVLLQSIIKHSPNCDTSSGGIMHKQCRRDEPCLFRRARQLLAGHGMEI